MERMSLEFIDRVAVLKFNHPEVMNAVGGQMLEDFAEAIAQIKARGSDTRCLLLTGEGRGFCAGANLNDDSDKRRKGGAGDGLRNTYHPLMFELRALNMPMVTAVNGAAAGAAATRAGDLPMDHVAAERLSRQRRRADHAATARGLSLPPKAATQPTTPHGVGHVQELRSASRVGIREPDGRVARARDVAGKVCPALVLVI